MPLNKLDIGAEMGKGWKLFQANMGLLILATLLVSVLSAVTCGILAGPMVAGLLTLVRRLIQNDPVKPQVGDVFKGFDLFVPTLILLLLGGVAIAVLSVIPVLGQLAGIVVGAVLGWAMMFVTYEKLSAIDAIKKVFGYAKSGEFTTPLLFVVLAGIVGGVGAIACGIGVFFTMPLAYCMLSGAYETLFGNANGNGSDAEVPPLPQV